MFDPRIGASHASRPSRRADEAFLLFLATLLSPLPPGTPYLYVHTCRPPQTAPEQSLFTSPTLFAATSLISAGAGSPLSLPLQDKLYLTTPGSTNARAFFPSPNTPGHRKAGHNRSFCSLVIATRHAEQQLDARPSLRTRPGYARRASEGYSFGCRPFAF